MQTIFGFIREKRDFYDTQSIHVNGIGEWSQKDFINKTDSYWSDNYEDDDAWDDVIGAFPFENIHKAPTLLESRATDFDQKHVENEPINGSREARISSMIVTKGLQKHMEDIRFGAFMNEVSYIRAKYGGVLATKEGENITVAKWQQLITDQADVMSAPRIQRYYMSPSELSKMSAWKNTKEAMKLAEDFRDQEIGDDNAQEQAESTGELIEIMVVEGDLKKCLFYSAQAIRDGKLYEEHEDDKYEYVYGRIIVCGADWISESDGKKFENGIVFYAEKEDKPLQKFLARNPLAGRGIGESVPEVLFEPQKWWNFYITEEVRMTAISGKKLYVTDDPDILANIFDEGVDHGTVLRVSQGKSLTELSQIPTGTPMYQSRRQEMFENVQRITSSFSAVIGEEAKSGTPFRAQYLQNIEASSQFEQYREEMGFFYKEIIEDWVLPDALAKLAQEDELYATFSPQELQLIDEVIVEKTLAEAAAEEILNGNILTPEGMEELRQETFRKLRKQGSKRTITGIQEFIKNAGKKVRIHTTDEARNKAVLFESYSNLLQLLDPQDPRFSALLDKVMQALGITKEELELYSDQSLMGTQGRVENKAMQAEGQPKAQQAVAALGQ